MLSTKKFYSVSAETSTEYSADLWLEVTVDVTELVELVHPHEHLRSIEPRVLLLQDSRVVQQRSEVPSRDVLLSISGRSMQ